MLCFFPIKQQTIRQGIHFNIQATYGCPASLLLTVFTNILHAGRRVADFRLEKKWLAVDSYLSEMSRHLPPDGQEQAHYRLTNAISQNLFKMPKMSALQYPSITTNLSCINLCMLPTVADEHFIPKKAWLLSVEGRQDQLPGTSTGNIFNLKFLRQSESFESDGTIKWSDERNFSLPEIEHLLRT